MTSFFGRRRTTSVMVSSPCANDANTMDLKLVIRRRTISFELEPSHALLPGLLSCIVCAVASRVCPATTAPQHAPRYFLALFLRDRSKCDRAAQALTADRASTQVDS